MLYYKIFIIYIDLITALIIGALHFTSIPISTFSGAFEGDIRYCLPPISTFSGAFVSEIQECLHEAILYKIYMVYRDFITMFMIGVLSFITTPISTFSGAFVSKIQ